MMVDVGRSLKKRQYPIFTCRNREKPRQTSVTITTLLSAFYPRSPENETGVLTTEQSYRSTLCKLDLLKMSLNKSQIRKQEYPETFLKSLSLIPICIPQK